MPAAPRRPNDRAGTLSRRTVILGACFGLPGVGLTSGCISSPVIENAAGVAKNAVFGHPELQLERAAVTKLPYASMRARVGRGPQAMLILSQIQGRDQHWLSRDRTVLVTRRGRIVKTFGFPDNLRGTEPLDDDPVDGLLHVLRHDAGHKRRIDLDLERRFGVLVESRFQRLGPRKLDIVEITFDTVLVREDCHAPGLRWRFANFYWVDPGDGFVWKSQQHVAPNYPAVEFEILKPAG